MAKKNKVDGEPIVIKKYANRRLYNTDSSSYVTLEDLASMVKANQEFIVVDAKSGDEITHSVLSQIIFEEESKGEALLPVNFLRQLIAFYGDGLQNVVPGYLESSMAAFCQNQEKFRHFFEDNLAKKTIAVNSMKPFEEMAKQNMVIFEKTMSMFSPFGANHDADKAEQAAGDSAKDQGHHPSHNSTQNSSKAKVDNDQLADLKAQLAMMQEQINGLQK